MRANAPAANLRSRPCARGAGAALAPGILPWSDRAL